MYDDKLARIRKLLARAEDPAATPAEAEAFNAKAAELLAPYAYEKGTLGAAFARGLRCSAVLRKQRGGGETAHSLHLFGHTTDLMLAEMLLTSLMVQGTGELTRRRVPPGEHPAAYRRT